MSTETGLLYTYTPDLELANEGIYEWYAEAVTGKRVKRNGWSGLEQVEHTILKQEAICWSLMERCTKGY
jgi:hypothetical protein